MQNSFLRHVVLNVWRILAHVALKSSGKRTRYKALLQAFASGAFRREEKMCGTRMARNALREIGNIMSLVKRVL